MSKTFPWFQYLCILQVFLFSPPIQWDITSIETVTVVCIISVHIHPFSRKGHLLFIEEYHLKLWKSRRKKILREKERISVNWENSVNHRSLHNSLVLAKWLTSHASKLILLNCLSYISLSIFFICFQVFLYLKVNWGKIFIFLLFPCFIEMQIYNILSKQVHRT